MRVTDIKFDRNKRGIARSGCVGWTGARARSLNDNYSCLSYRSQRGWIVQNLRRLFGWGCAHMLLAEKKRKVGNKAESFDRSL